LNTCSAVACNYEIYDNRKCIFHCDKNNWNYSKTNDEYIDPDSAYDEYLFRVENFWQEFNSLKEDEFHDYIFPLVDSTYINYSKNNITFINCTFLDDIYIKKQEDILAITIENSLLKFVDCVFYSEKILINKDIQTFIFHNGKMKKHASINIKTSHISHLDIQNIANCSLIIENSDFDKIKVIGSKFTKLVLVNLDLKENSTLLFEDLTIMTLLIEKLSQDSRYLQFNNMTISNNIDFRKIEFKNTYFNDLKIDKIKNNFKIEKTSFLGANFNSVSWGNLSSIEASRDTFRELKYVHDKQKDYINADIFYIEEMKRHRNYLQQLNKEGSNNIQDRFMFWINEQLSGFGSNWLLPVIWYILISLWFILYVKVQVYLNVDIDYITTIKLLTLSDLLIPLSTIMLLLVFIAYKFVSNKLILTLAISMTIYLLHAYLNNYHALNEFSDFINLKFNNEYKGFSFVWFLHKLITGFIIYHLVVSLRRKTKR